MNATEVLRIVDAIHRDKNIDKEIVFQAIEAALGLGRQEAIRRRRGHRRQYRPRRRFDLRHAQRRAARSAKKRSGRIVAQTAKQVMIQKIREAERDALYDEYDELIGQMVTGVVQRYEGGAATVSLATPKPFCRAASRFPAKRIMPTSACGPRCSKSARSAAA